MADFFRELDERLTRFVTGQAMFFVATAPKEGRVNLSPKGMDSFRVLDRRTVAYLDLTGSGNETAAHLAQNSRITLMFCSFDRQPLILRIYGSGRSIKPRDREWEGLCAKFEDYPGKRQIMQIEIGSIQTSCGYAVPEYELKGPREMLLRWAEKKGPAGVEDYQRENNRIAIDGLPTHLIED